MKSVARILLLCSLSLVAAPSFAGRGEEERATVRVECARNSAFIQVAINSYRKIGRVDIEVRDAQGRVWYKEEGKAFTDVLMRRLDKGAFPKGKMSLTVKARDLAITQHFVVQ